MTTLDSPIPSSIDEQLIAAERKFQEFLKADVEFDLLKPLWVKIKELKAELKKNSLH